MENKISNNCKKNKLNSLHEKLSEYFHEFCNKTTFHGLKFVGDSSISWFERLFFAAAFFLVSIGAGYFIWHAYSKWCLSPIFIGFSATPFYINEIPFPTVTICNMNQALSSKVKGIKENTPEHLFLQTICEINDNLWQDKINESESNFKNFEHFIERVAQPCDKMIISCEFSKASNFVCSEVFVPVITDEGLCCTFNAVHRDFLYNYRTIQPDDEDVELYHRVKKGSKSSKAFTAANQKYLKSVLQNGSKPVHWNAETGYPKNLHISQKNYPRPGIGTGVSMGLNLILDAEIDEYYCSSTNSAGFKVLIHSPVEVPHIKETGISIDVGTENRIRITPEYELASKSVKNNIDIKYRQCFFNNEKKLTYFRTYTRRNCEMECEAALLAKNCNCIRYYMPIVRPNISICGIKESDCVNKFTFKSRLMKDNLKNCNEICLPSCFDLSFLQDVFTTKIATRNFSKKNTQLLSKMKTEYVSQSISILSFYYKENAFYGQKKEEFTGMTEFLSNTGGLMGLFLGFSCISIVEIFYYLTIRPICALIRRRRKVN